LSVSFTAVLVLKHSCSGYSTIVPEHSWMQDVLAQLGLAGYNQELDLSCIPCLSYSNKQPRTVIPKSLDSVIPTKLLVGILVLLLHDFNQEEQIFVIERMKNSPRRKDNCSTANRFQFALPNTRLQRATTVFSRADPETSSG